VVQHEHEEDVEEGVVPEWERERERGREDGERKDRETLSLC
jgi:hypothetical protein